MLYYITTYYIVLYYIVVLYCIIGGALRRRGGAEAGPARPPAGHALRQPLRRLLQASALMTML